MLGALVSAIEASPDITEVNKFSDCEKALEFVKQNSVDIAFLDINMRGMGGLALAEKIIAASPDCKIVFCTGYEEYAIPAFKLHVSGYLLKPISAEDVQTEIDNIIGVRHKEKPITVKCFGNFEVYARNKKLVFKRLKTKELLAFLIDRNGAGMTAKQICAVLFPDDTDDNKNAAYLRQLVLDLKNTLKAVGAEGVLCHETPCYRIDTSLIRCDYLSYLETGKPEFHGEYMTQYSWAEET
jgi:two-component SAPR family response regulator